ncbi:MAG: acyl-CoA dehydrogenase family protein [Halieaceae bacterium]
MITEFDSLAERGAGFRKTQPSQQARTPLELMYREARYARIYDGPDEVHRMTVAKRLLKDPTGNAPWN